MSLDAFASQSRSQNFSDKVALITGSSTGIGAAIATEFALRGAGVALVGRRANLLTAKAEALQAQGLNTLAVPGDVATDAEAIVQSVVEHFGRLDVVVNNAAISAGVSMNDMTIDAWRRVMGINLDGAFQLVSYALPHLVASRGNVLHISSISAISGDFDDVAYASSKAALEGFSRKLALEVAVHGVRSNVIRPGLIMTEAFAEMPADFFKTQIPLIPLGQIGQPHDIATAAAYLCSEDASFITGAVLTIDGGESAK